ncbi:MAG TPA: hypothetical protein VMB53_04785, partial [Gaiellaceae bacterium]|nr:hypothetical protein [Gaiellaceae bacterium]
MNRFPQTLAVKVTRERALLAWVALLTISAAGMCVTLVLAGYRVEQPLTVAILAVLAVGAEYESIRLTPTVQMSVVSILCIFAAVVLGPLAAIVVSAAAVLANFPRRDGNSPVLRWITWTAVSVIVAGCAGLAAVAVLSRVERNFWGIFAAVAAAFLVETLVDLVLVGVAPAIRGTGSWTKSAKTVGAANLSSVPLQVPMVALLAYSYETISPWSVALFAIPAVAAQRLLLLYRQQIETAEALGEANKRLAGANLSFATALVATLDARDRYTAGHSAAVAIYAADIAARMGL